MEAEDLKNRFTYHAPDDKKVFEHSNVRQSFHLIAAQLNACLPEGREKSLAMTKIEEAMFWANAALARHE